jgi:DNA polymerase III sliding clamp (beta) subunit (PCNA family)
MRVEFKIKRMYLESLLDKAMTVKTKTGIDSLLRSFLLEIVDDRLRVLRTDTTLSVVAETSGIEIKKSAQLTSRVLVDGDKFYELVKNLESDDVTIIITDDRSIIISTGAFEAQWKTFKVDNYPETPNPEQTEMFELPSFAFIVAVERVRHAMATEGVQKNFCQVFFDETGCWAHNGFVFQRVDFETPQKFALAAEGLEVLKFIKLSGAETFKIGFTDEYTIFEIGNDLFICRVPNLQIPFVGLVEEFKKSRQGRFGFEVGQLQHLVKRVSLSSDLGKRDIIFETTAELLTVTATDGLGNKSHEQMVITFTGSQTAKKKFHVDWTFLTDALAAVKKKSATMVIDVNHIMINTDDSSSIIPMMGK